MKVVQLHDFCQGLTIVPNNFAFEVKIDLCLNYTFTGGGGWLN